jgi:hypothetical protein
MLGIHTVVEVDAEKSSVGQGIEVYEVSFRLFDLFALEGKLSLCKCPEFALGRFPVAGCHAGSTGRSRQDPNMLLNQSRKKKGSDLSMKGL